MSKPIIINIHNLVGCIVVVNTTDNDPTEEIQKKIKEALLSVLSQAQESQE